MTDSRRQTLTTNRQAILAVLVREGWLACGQGLLSPARFAEMMAAAEAAVARRLTQLSDGELVALLGDYLRVNEFDVESPAEIDATTVLHYTFAKPGAPLLHGWGAAARVWTEQLGRLSRIHPGAAFHHVLALDGVPERLSTTLTHVTPADITRTVIAGIYFGPFLDEYSTTVITQRLTKELYAHLERQYRLIPELRDHLRCGLARENVAAAKMTGR